MVVLLNGGRIYGEKLFRGVFFLYNYFRETTSTNSHFSVAKCFVRTCSILIIYVKKGLN
jgi:hypothetical protein